MQVAVQALLTLLPLPFANVLGWRHIGFVGPHNWPVVLLPALGAMEAVPTR